jgi:hypothetical protein
VMREACSSVRGGSTPSQRTEPHAVLWWQPVQGDSQAGRADLQAAAGRQCSRWQPATQSPAPLQTAAEGIVQRFQWLLELCVSEGSVACLH